MENILLLFHIIVHWACALFGAVLRLLGPLQTSCIELSTCAITQQGF